MCEQGSDASEVRRLVETMQFEEDRAARDLVGSDGHFIQKIGDKFGVFAPDGMLLTLKRDKPEAERCALEHAARGVWLGSPFARLPSALF